MKYCYYFLALLICGGCSLPRTTVTQPTDLGGSHVAKVFNIRFNRWSTPIFSGLLAIKRERDTLYYVLLDGSGITLAQARVHSDGSFTDLKAITKIKESQLPAFLATTLQRVYLIKPADKSCSQTFFFKLCEEKGTTRSRKFMRAGPFTVYDAQYIKENNSQVVATLVFSQPWLGIEMTLTPLKSNKRPL